MMKKLKKFLIFMLILPLCMAVVSCKKNNENNSSNSNPQQQQPSVPSQPENPTNPEEPEDPEEPEEPEDPEVPSVSTYSVQFNYNLDDDFAELAEDYKVDNIVVGQAQALPVISDINLAKYFLGWYNEDTLVENSVTGEKDQSIVLDAHWRDDLSDGYYSVGLNFEVVSNDDDSYAAVSGYTGNKTTVFIPKVVTINQTEYEVKKIAASAFNESNLTKVVISAKDYVVGENAFYNSKLTEIDLTEAVSIESGAFSKSMIKNAILHSKLQELGKSVFVDCSKLESVDFSHISTDYIIAIPDYTFSGCTSLNSVALNSYINSIGLRAFSGCTSLANIEFLSQNITTIGAYAFEDCKSISSVVLSITVSNISGRIFSGCSGLKEISTYSLYMVGAEDTFSNPFGDLQETLETVNFLGSSIVEIPTYYFNNYTALKTVSLSSSIRYLRNYAFSGCTSLSSISPITSLDAESFSVLSVSDTLWYKNYSEPLVVGDVLVLVPTSTSGEVTIPSGTRVVSSSAFAGNTNITKINVPSTVENLGTGTFSNCTALTDVVFAENTLLTVLGNEIFSGCSSLTSINLENLSTLTEIGDRAFSGVGQVENLILPSTIETISIKAFCNAGISSFEISGSTLFYTQDGVLYSVDSQDSSVTLFAYPKLRQGISYVIPSAVTKVEDYAFYAVKNLRALIVSSTTLSFKMTSGTIHTFDDRTNRFFNIYSQEYNALNIQDSFYLKVSYYLDSANYTYEFVEDQLVVTLIDGQNINNGGYYININNGEADHYYYIKVQDGELSQDPNNIDNYFI